MSLLSKILLLVLVWDVIESQGQDEKKLKPGRLPTEVRKSLVPGIYAEYFSAGHVIDSRIQRIPALYVERDEPISPFVHTGERQLRFSGFIKLKLKGSYSFSIVGTGMVSLSVNGKKLIESGGDFSKAAPESIELVKGYNRIEAIYSATNLSAAQLRIYWESDSFVREPIPPAVFWTAGANSTDVNATPNSKTVAGHEQVHLGRELFLRHNCLKCHAKNITPNTLFQDRDSPDLKIAASRIKKNWIENWLAAPEQMRNATTMPRFFGASEQSKKDIADIAEFIFSQSKSLPTTNSGDVDRGGDAFENLGCIGCHHFQKPDFEDEYERISLYYANSKYRLGQMAEFLKDSRKHYKWSRMPKFRINQQEGQDLEAFIRDESKGELNEVDGGAKADGARGKELFLNLGCANCHQEMLGGKSTLQTVTLKDAPSNAGCLSTPGDRKSGVPNFGFDEIENKAVQKFIDQDQLRSLTKINKSFFAARVLKEMRCTSCHDLDDEQATLPYIIEEEGVVGLPPNRVPMLTYAGEKLMPKWSSQLVSGELKYRVREHFRVQMPGFPERGKLTAEGLSHMHGFAPEENAGVEPDAALGKMGEKVAAMESGLSCNRCHAIADKKPNAAFDAQSTNLIYAANRLRKEYYLRWMFDPIRIDKQTKMPRFSEDRKTTSLKSLYDGNAKQQFESLWQYLNQIRDKP